MLKAIAIIAAIAMPLPAQGQDEDDPYCRMAGHFLAGISVRVQTEATLLEDFYGLIERHLVPVKDVHDRAYWAEVWAVIRFDNLTPEEIGSSWAAGCVERD
ncbi:MAG: hypothetical protein KDK28_02110 [Maritimibacter sp.]|nr:hypothetical protein [Maritimibacter sp.]